MGFETTMKSNILFHFIKRKISLTSMKTILIIPGELEYLEGLVKLTKRKKDAKGQINQVAAIHSTFAIKRVSVNKTHHNKTSHLAIEINQVMIEGLGDAGASMLVMAAIVVKELGIKHMVVGTYKTTFGIVMHAFGKIIELPIKMGAIICQMIFLMVDTYNYDLLFELDFSTK
jgi:hypothetical protein